MIANRQLRSNIADVLILALCMSPAVIGVVLWIVTMVAPIGLFALWPGASLNLAHGRFEIRRITASAIAPPVPRANWHEIAVARGWTLPPRSTGFPRFQHTSGHVTGILAPDGATISPASYSFTLIPMWILILPTLLLWPIMRRRWARISADHRRGFPIALSNRS